MVSRDGIFLNRNVKLGIASIRFCDSLQKLVDNYADVVDVYVRSSRANTHGIQKGAATFSTNGTIVPSSLISLTLCGE